MISTTALTDLYTEIQQFYARQVHLLDDNAFQEFAATFTVETEFSHHPDEKPARSRAEIVNMLTRLIETRFGNARVQRRHWFNMLAVNPRDDGTIGTTFYALVITTWPGSPPVIAPSCVAHDILVREAGQLLTRSRRVQRDGVR